MWGLAGLVTIMSLGCASPSDRVRPDQCRPTLDQIGQMLAPAATSHALDDLDLAALVPGVRCPY